MAAWVSLEEVSDHPSLPDFKTMSFTLSLWNGSLWFLISFGSRMSSKQGGGDLGEGVSLPPLTSRNIITP